MIPTVYKIQTIGSGSLSLMAKPVSGEFLKDEILGLVQLGISQIVSLLERSEQYSVGLSEEEAHCISANVEFLSFPIPDRGLPKSLLKFSQITKTIHINIECGFHTVVHCRAGIGRAGLVSAGVLLQTGLSAKVAFDLVSESRGVQVPDTDEQYQWLVDNQKEIQSTT